MPLDSEHFGLNLEDIRRAKISHDVIICGSGGTPVVEKTIVVYDAALSVAIKIAPHELEEQAVAAGMDRHKVQLRVACLVQMIENDWHDWAEFIEEKLCLEYTRHAPHAANFDEP